MINILDINRGKRYDVKDIYVVRHETDSESDGKCVEFTVVGKNRSWRNWMPYEDFAKGNPEIQIEEKNDSKENLTDGNKK